jgi:hypothetical protein
MEHHSGARHDDEGDDRHCGDTDQSHEHADRADQRGENERDTGPCAA